MFTFTKNHFLSFLRPRPWITLLRLLLPHLACENWKSRPVLYTFLKSKDLCCLCVCSSPINSVCYFFVCWNYDKIESKISVCFFQVSKIGGSIAPIETQPFRLLDTSHIKYALLHKSLVYNFFWKQGKRFAQTTVFRSYQCFSLIASIHQWLRQISMKLTTFFDPSPLFYLPQTQPKTLNELIS